MRRRRFVRQTVAALGLAGMASISGCTTRAIERAREANPTDKIKELRKDIADSRNNRMDSDAPDIPTFEAIHVAEDQLSPVEETEQVIYSEMNKYRKKNGNSRMMYDDYLARINRTHSRNMLVHEFIGHKDHIGRIPYERAAYYGHPTPGVKEILTVLPVRWLNREYGDVSPQTVAIASVEGWDKNSGHREALRNPDHITTGVGVYANKRESDHSPQVFVTAGLIDSPPAKGPKRN